MKILSKARQVRLSHQVKLGRPVTVEEVAREADVDRNALTRLELGKTTRFDGEILAKLCAYYGVGIADLLEYSEELERPDYAPGNLVAA